MNHKLIMLPNPILVSDEEIEKGDWFYYYSHGKFNMYMCEGVVGKSLVVQNKESSCWSDYSKKIIAGIEGLPKLDLSAIAERIGWVDVEKLAHKCFPKKERLSYGKCYSYDNEKSREGFIAGFKAAQSLNEKKFSEEDVKKAILMAWDDSVDTKNVYDIIESLSKPKEYNVEVEMELFNTKQSTDYTPYEKGSLIPIIKITNNTIKVTKIINQI